MRPYEAHGGRGIDLRTLIMKSGAWPGHASPLQGVARGHTAYLTGWAPIL